MQPTHRSPGQESLFNADYLPATMLTDKPSVVIDIDPGMHRTGVATPDDVVELAKKIEQELTYPGQIKVVAIREKRAMDIAR